MPMKIMSILFSLVSLFLASRSRASTSGSGVPAWRSIEMDMRQEGCFAPPIATLLDALQSEEVLCRFRAVRALGLRGDRTSIPALKPLHESDPDPGVKIQAAVELVRLGERRYLSAVREAMEKEPTLGRKASLAGQLAQIGDTSGYTHVENACRSSNRLERIDCVSVLGYFIGAAEKEPGLRTALLSELLELAADSESSVGEGAIYTLSGWGREALLPPSAIVQLEKLAVATPNAKVREVARRAAEDQKRKQRDQKKSGRNGSDLAGTEESDAEKNRWLASCAQAYGLAKRLAAREAEGPRVEERSSSRLFVGENLLAERFVDACFTLLGRSPEYEAAERAWLTHIGWPPRVRCSENELKVWLNQCFEDAKTLKRGASRGQLLETFGGDGGVAWRGSRTFVHRRCEVLKVDATFRWTGSPMDGEERLGDEVEECVYYIGLRNLM